MLEFKVTETMTKTDVSEDGNVSQEDLELVEILNERECNADAEKVSSLPEEIKVKLRNTEDTMVYWKKQSTQCPKILYGILLKATIIMHQSELILIFDEAEEVIELIGIQGCA